MLVRKIDKKWIPAEYPNLGVGDVIDITNARELLELGTVELVKKHRCIGKSMFKKVKSIFDRRK